MARLQLSLLTIFSLCLFLFPSGVFSQSTFTIVNTCTYQIWPALISNAGIPQLPNNGFLLDPNYYTTISIPEFWAGGVWARTLCSTDANGQFTCATGDCGSGAIGCTDSGIPPATLFEIALDTDYGLDNYDISLVNGFNIPMNVVTQGGAWTCSSIGCSTDISAECPTELQEIDNGVVVGCKSACVAFGGPTYCCNEPGETCANCGPTSYSEFFKNVCPQAITYVCDSGLVTCTSATYTITFCP